MGQYPFPNPVKYYRDYELDSIRGDILEGNRAWRPQEGLQMNFVETGEQRTLSREHFHPMAKSDDIFVSCMSLNLDNELYDEFKTDVCVEILDCERFVRRICDSIAKRLGNASAEKLVAKKVDYYKRSDPIGVTWALPERIACSKEMSYLGQAEYRVAFPINDAFRHENVTIQIGPIENLKRGKGPYKEFFASIGNIREYARIKRKRA